MTPISIHVIYHSSQVIRGLRIDLQPVILAHPSIIAITGLDCFTSHNTDLFLTGLFLRIAGQNLPARPYRCHGNIMLEHNNAMNGHDHARAR
jgi:hypothetical protein